MITFGHYWGQGSVSVSGQEPMGVESGTGVVVKGSVGTKWGLKLWGVCLTGTEAEDEVEFKATVWSWLWLKAGAGFRTKAGAEDKVEFEVEITVMVSLATKIEVRIEVVRMEVEATFLFPFKIFNGFLGYCLLFINFICELSKMRVDFSAQTYR